jgi:hypothetical protein
VGAAWDVATLPVKGAGKVVDWTTTSRDEADRNAGRAIRKADALQRRDGRVSCTAKSGECPGDRDRGVYFEVSNSGQ